jgi:hypothetical protein
MPKSARRRRASASAGRGASTPTRRFVRLEPPPRKTTSNLGSAHPASQQAQEPRCTRSDPPTSACHSHQPGRQAPLSIRPGARRVTAQAAPRIAASGTARYLVAVPLTGRRLLNTARAAQCRVVEKENNLIQSDTKVICCQTNLQRDGDGTRQAAAASRTAGKRPRPLSAA